MNYDKLREIVGEEVGASKTYDRIMHAIDTYREELAKRVEGEILPLPEGETRNYEQALIATVRQDDARIIRIT